MIKNIKEFSNKCEILIFFLAIFSLVIAIFYSDIDQRAVNASLYLSKHIVNSNDLSLLSLVYSNSYTSIYQILTILLKLGFSPENLNFFILFLSSIINSLGIFLISRSLTENNFISFLIAIFLILTKLNLGNLDYPVLILSEHTNGMLGSAFPILILGLIGNKNFRLALIFCIINVSFHVVIGGWFTLITLISIYFHNKELIISLKKNKNNIIIFSLLLLLFFLSILHFLFEKIYIPFDYDHELFQSYMLYWELHRSNTIPINFKYIFLSGLLLIISIFYMRNIEDKKNNSNKILMLKILIIHIIFSFLIYISYKYFPNIFHEKIVTLMPSRLFLIHSFLGISIIISIIFYFLFNFFKKKKFLYFLLLFLILIHPTIYFQKYLKKVNTLYSSFIIKNNYDVHFWKSIESEKFNGGYFLSTPSACSKIIQKSKKPLLICIESIDYLPYLPNLVLPVSKIIEEIYEVSFQKPPEKNHGGLWYDSSYKNIFEKRTKDKWIKIAEKFNLNGLILPVTWELNLDKTLIGKNYTYYRF